MQQLKEAGIVALTVTLGACSQAHNDGARRDEKATSSNSSQPASLDREPPAFAAFVPPPQKAAALAAWREASFGHMADVTASLQTGLVIPLAGFCVVLANGLSGHK